METPRPPQGPVGSGCWWVCRSWALEWKTDASDGRGSWVAVRTDSGVRGLVIILKLVWKLDRGTCMKTPSLLDAWLNHGSIVVDALSADGAGRKRHVQIVKVRDARSGEDGGGSSGTCLRCQEEMRRGWGSTDPSIKALI